MPRTTINIDAPVLKDLKSLQKKEGKSLGRLVSDLLVEALGHRKSGKSKLPAFQWNAKAMGARVDLDDKEALRIALNKTRARSRTLTRDDS